MKQSEVTEWVRSFVSDGVTIKQLVVAVKTVLLERQSEEARRAGVLENYLDGLVNYLFADTALSKWFFPYRLDDEEEGTTVMAISPGRTEPSFVFGRENGNMINVAVGRDETPSIHVAVGFAEKAGVHQDSSYRYLGAAFTGFVEGEEVHLFNDSERSGQEVIDEMFKEDDIERTLDGQPLDVVERLSELFEESRENGRTLGRVQYMMQEEGMSDQEIAGELDKAPSDFVGAIRVLLENGDMWSPDFEEEGDE